MSELTLLSFPAATALRQVLSGPVPPQQATCTSVILTNQKHYFLKMSLIQQIFCKSLQCIGISICHT